MMPIIYLILGMLLRINLRSHDRTFEVTTIVYTCIAGIFSFIMILILLLHSIKKTQNGKLYKRNIEIALVCDKWNYNFFDSKGLHIRTGPLAAWLELTNMETTTNEFMINNTSIVKEESLKQTKNDKRFIETSLSLGA